LDLAVGVSDARACRAVLVRFLAVTAPFTLKPANSGLIYTAQRDAA
jgi:hypothetical protein